MTMDVSARKTKQNISSSRWAM